MKHKVLSVLASLIIRLQKYHIKLTATAEENINTYSSLSPISNADPENHYTKALNWALKTRRKMILKILP